MTANVTYNPFNYTIENKIELIKKEYENLFIAGLTNYPELWLGINSINEKHEFLTFENEKLGFTRWSDKKSARKQNRGVILDKKSKKWIDVQISEMKPVICEMKSE